MTGEELVAVQARCCGKSGGGWPLEAEQFEVGVAGLAKLGSGALGEAHFRSLKCVGTTSRARQSRMPASRGP